MQESTIYVDAEPLAREGEWAVWRALDIPSGVARGFCYSILGCSQDELDALIVDILKVECCNTRYLRIHTLIGV